MHLVCSFTHRRWLLDELRVTELLPTPHPHPTSSIFCAKTCCLVHWYRIGGAGGAQETNVTSTQVYGSQNTPTRPSPFPSEHLPHL